MATTKCIVILSEKSSGSSACQNILAKFGAIHHVASTRHGEFETLYWTKAASILNLPQLDMVDSEVPVPAQRARTELVEFLQNNVSGFQFPDNDREMIFEGWKSLCRNHQPIYLEKSPHHLCQWSALELMYQCMQEAEDIDFLFIGLVRNPMDTFYSQFQRWRTRPESVQSQWLTAYRNLQRFQQLVGPKLVMVRYEDLIRSVAFLKPVLDFCEVKIADADMDYFHPNSLLKWQSDERFGFVLSDEVFALAKQYGYQDEELYNPKKPLWIFYRELCRALFKIKKLFKRSLILKAVKHGLLRWMHSCYRLLIHDKPT